MNARDLLQRRVDLKRRAVEARDPEDRLDAVYVLEAVDREIVRHGMAPLRVQIPLTSPTED